MHSKKTIHDYTNTRNNTDALSLTPTIPTPILPSSNPQNLKAVRINRYTEMVKPDDSRRRVLSFLLLGLILYGTTVQAVHKHGLAPASPVESAAVSIPAPEDSSTSGVAGCADCLVCQLQQSFSATLLTHRDLDPPATQTVRFFDIGAPSAASFVTIKESGRAPPFTS